ncbi:MAG TPA: type II toxin-antitoxin system VapC family toxin [Terriglobia bacterium]|nr:type II toxin-antitoxin system VapC family toxin [Terriglobia bacterium]
MIILDTNVLSALMSSVPDRHVIAWLDKQPEISLWTNSVTVLEIRYGLQIMPAGKRRTALMEAFERVLTELLDLRVAPFDAAAAMEASDLMAIRHKLGRPVELRDMMIAGIALACRATLATRNTAHFDGLSVPVINPFKES